MNSIGYRIHMSLATVCVAPRFTTFHVRQTRHTTRCLIDWGRELLALWSEELSSSHEHCLPSELCSQQTCSS